MIGGCTVDELQERMENSEFNDWIAWAKIRGMFGEERADLRIGQLCALVENLAFAYRGQKGNAKATDFMPFYEKPKPNPATAEQTREQVEALQQVFGVEEG